MSYHHLTFDERNVIYRMGVLGKSQAQMARCLGRHRSTICRELRRNVSCVGEYFCNTAQAKANCRRRAHICHPKTGNHRLMGYVADKLQRRWSPQQISGRLRELPVDTFAGAAISHATIYRWIWADTQRAQRLKGYLRVACKARRKPYGKPSKRGQIPDRVSIDQRPEVVAQRQRIGDWEGDTVVGKGRSGYVATCVDRASRYLVARKLTACSAKQLKEGLHDAMRRLPFAKRKTLTVDNGREFACHKDLRRLLRLDVYFAHAYRSWERGTNENTNGLLRQYLPKRMRFSALTDRQLESYIRQLNNRPRKCLNYRTPAEVFHQRDVALTL
jgi:IS30 family transposase